MKVSPLVLTSWFLTTTSVDCFFAPISHPFHKFRPAATCSKVITNPAVFMVTTVEKPQKQKREKDSSNEEEQEKDESTAVLEPLDIGNETESIIAHSNKETTSKETKEPVNNTNKETKKLVTKFHEETKEPVTYYVHDEPDRKADDENATSSPILQKDIDKRKKLIIPNKLITKKSEVESKLDAEVDISLQKESVVKGQLSVTPFKDKPQAEELSPEDKSLLEALEQETQLTVDSIMNEELCEVDPETGMAKDEECLDESRFQRAKSKFKRIVSKTLNLVRGEDEDEDDQDEDFFQSRRNDDYDDENMSPGEKLERGWEERANASALRRNSEVWKFALQCVFKTLKARKLSKKGASDEEVSQARVEAAEFLRDGLLKLGPTFVKLGQVVSTRTDVLPKEFTDTLKSLQDDVPGFDGKRAKEIVSKELGKPCDSVFSQFQVRPIKAASLGQVHTAFYKGKKVAIKVQRAGLKELFDIDLKNLQKLAELLDKFDPKTDGADRDWVGIYKDSEKMLYKEIDYLNEAANAERFARDFSDTSWVRVPEVFREVSTPRVLTMEFVDSFKLTDLENVDRLGLDRELLAKRTADAFLKQIVETGYFHADPHPGNLCVDTKGNLVYYDYGMMDELKPNVKSGFRKFCTALFAGGPTVDDLTLAKNAKMLVDGVEDAGVLAKGADRLAVEKLARYFMRSFKDNQLGKKSGKGIKQTVGTDLQTLTENNVFRFPSTFTFIFRSFASVDGIGKGLDKDYDIGKLAQPFIEKFTDSQEKYGSEAEKSFNIFQRATGLNLKDVNTAVTSPRKIQYIEETLRSMENGNLKIRVRSLENEKMLERMMLTQNRMEKLLLSSVSLGVMSAAAGPICTGLGLTGATVFGFQALMANVKVKKFDKTQEKFVQTNFED